MIALIFLVYAAIGAASGWGLFTYAGVELPLAICAGAIITALLGQVHLFATRGGGSKDVQNRLDLVETAQRDTYERVGVVEARTDAVESTVKHELTERRDALVSEMKQLETLIDRLSRSFEIS